MVEDDGFVDWDDVGYSVAGIDDYAGGETLVGMSARSSELSAGDVKLSIPCA